MMADQRELRERNESGRWRVLLFLAKRSALAFSLADICDLINERRRLNYTEDELTSWLGFLKDRGLVKDETDPMGSTIYYQATAEGVLEVERFGR